MEMSWFAEAAAARRGRASAGSHTSGFLTGGGSALPCRATSGLTARLWEQCDSNGEGRVLHEVRAISRNRRTAWFRRKWVFSLITDNPDQR